MKKLYLNYGCGLCAPENWVNFDSSPNLRLERLPIVGFLYAGHKADTPGKLIKKRYPNHIRYGDIVRGLPIPYNSCGGIYASHILEHLSLSDFRLALANTLSYLDTDGIFRLVVPDLEVLIQRYVSDNSPEASIRFLRSCGLGKEYRSKGLKSFLYDFLANSAHLWMWDYKSLEDELIKSGFSSVRRAFFNDSVDTKFIEVEQQDRFTDAIAIEALKK